MDIQKCGKPSFLSQEELDKTRELAFCMLDSVPVGCLVFNENSDCLDCNNTAVRFSKAKDKQDFLSRLADLLPAFQEGGKETGTLLRGYAREAKKNGSCSFELTFRLLDGNEFPAFVTLTSTKYGGKAAILMTVKDFSAQKRLMTKYEVLLDNLPGMAYQCLWDPPQNPITFASKGSKDLVGYTPQELVGGGKYMEMGFAEDLDNQREQWVKAIEIGLLYEYSFRVKTRDNSVKWLLAREKAVEFHANGTPSLIQGYVFDITERIQIQSAEIAKQAKTDFLAIMNHEVRTPMNSIISFAELAQDSDDILQIKNYTEKIVESTKWLLRVLSDTLDISKIEAGKIEMVRIPFSLDEVVRHCQNALAPNVKEKKLGLKTVVNVAGGKKFMGDPVRLYQVLMNLLSNAVKFSNDGEISLLVERAKPEGGALAGGKETIRFEVKDQGIGLSAEQIKKIFSPFVQADSGPTRKYGGVGLGLSISKSLVEMMGGSLWVESSPGEGSSFGFEAAFEAAPMEKEAAKFAEKPRFKGDVLVCEDNPMNQEVVREQLSRVGLDAVIAENGEVGVEKVRARKAAGEKPFDLIFMDIFMPVMDGLEAAAKIFAIENASPVVAMTANIMTDDLERYKKAGLSDCIGKPFGTQDLWDILKKYLSPASPEPASPEASVPEKKDHNTELFEKLQIQFFKNNQKKFEEIAAALNEGSIKTAHRLAHSLKGNAGFIRQKTLQDIAGNIENILAGKEVLTTGVSIVLSDVMRLLEFELAKVLQELRLVYDEYQAQAGQRYLETDLALQLLEKLEVMLENANPHCIEMLDDLRAVYGSEELASQIEDYDFEAALKTLEVLKSKVKKDGAADGN